MSTRQNVRKPSGRRQKGIYAETGGAFGLRRQPLGAWENTPQLSKRRMRFFGAH